MAVTAARCTDEHHQRLKDDPEAFAWGTVAIGWQSIGDGERIVLANCAVCGSTLTPSFYPERRRPLPLARPTRDDHDLAYDEFAVGPERDRAFEARELERELAGDIALLERLRAERRQLEAECERAMPRPGSVGHITQCLAEEENL